MSSQQTSYAETHRCDREMPPRLRSLPVLEGSSQIEPSAKQKKAEQIDKSDTTYSTGEVFKATISSLLGEVKRLEKVVRELYKPKQEVKDVAGKLTFKAEKLQSQVLMDWLDNMVEITKGRESQAGVDNEQVLANDGEWCDQCKVMRLRKSRRLAFLKDVSFENFCQVTEDDWSNEVFPRIKTVGGVIWDTPISCDVILPCNEDFVSANKNVEIGIKKFGGIEGLKNQTKKSGEVAIMVHSLGFPDDEGNMSYSERTIYYPILSEGGFHEEAEDQIMFQALHKVKQLALKRGKTELAVPELQGVGGMMFARMLEYLFANSEVTIKMYKYKKDSLANSAIPSQNETTLPAFTENTKTQIKARHEAILVKMEGKTYADLLKTVKNSLNPTDLGVEVNNIFKTRKGELLLTVSNGAEKAQLLKRNLRQKLPEANTSFLLKKKVLHIKDMDEVTTTEEISDAISKATGSKPEALEIRALRPSYGNKQNVTVITSEATANLLLQRGRILIGWTSCRVIERMRDLKCYRCWELGHVKAHCSGPDREHLCLKCAKSGHLLKDCPNSFYCVHCKIEGHQSNSQRCPLAGRMTDTRSNRKINEDSAN